MFDPRTVRDTYVTPALTLLNRNHPMDEMMLMGTACVESQFRWTTQMGGGPARGLCEMEGPTHDDCWTNYIDFQPELKKLVLSGRIATGTPHADEMVTDHKYAFIMCRVRYMRVKEALPAEPSGLAAYWKTYYNSEFGAGHVIDFVNDWNRLLTGLYAPISVSVV